MKYSCKVVIHFYTPGILVGGPFHDDVIKWKHFPRYWPFVRGIHQSLVNSPHKGQWRGAFMFSLICAWINLWVNNHEAGDLRCYRAHYDVIVMQWGSHMLKRSLTGWENPNIIGERVMVEYYKNCSFFMADVLLQLKFLFQCKDLVTVKSLI